MAKINDIDWKTDPSSFLDPNTTSYLAQDFTSGLLSSEFDKIINDLNSEMDRGLSADALNLEGSSPLNQTAQELSLKLQGVSEKLENIGNQIMSDGNKHTTEEVNVYYEKVMEEYNRRKAGLRNAVENYNSSRVVPKESGEKAPNGSPLTEFLPEIRLVNGDDNLYEKVVITGEINPRSIFYDAVMGWLANTEEIYDDSPPERAYRYKVMWGDLPYVDGSTKSAGETITASKKGWSSYDEAAAAGFSNVMTESEFARSNTEYGSYQEYLDAMNNKYVTNSTDSLEYQPEVKNGKINTRLKDNDNNYVEFDGDYVEFKNDDGTVTKAPLAIAKYENGNVVYIPMTEEQKEDYTRKITQYYNDIADVSENYSDKFKKEIADRVDGITYVYVDPSSRKEINYANDWAGWCQANSAFSNHSNILIYSDQFVDLDNINDSVSYDYMVNETYTHELGHAYANNRMMPFPDRDKNTEWLKIYDAVSSDETNKQILEEYALTNAVELFADSTAFYYSNPNRLKQVEINNELYDNLYDYMDDILN